MFVKESNISVVKSGNFDTGDFRIKASAKAFKILSSQLYQNKVLAIIRELSCNAYDSHIAVNKSNIPFDIHLPNTLEPWFFVRDYGTGLSHEDICSIYTTYFESTKTTSNNYVGCLGLGSKTPFAYTDMFSVTSFFNGVKRVYSAYIGEAGFPSISLITEEDTEEDNGLLVQLAVESKDFREFSDTAKDIFTHFDTQPNILGAKIDLFTKEIDFSGESFYKAKINQKYPEQSYAVMGNVCYPIGINNFARGELKNNTIQVLDCCLFIKFEIGELEITPSRESLSYDKETKSAIINKLNKVETELTNFVQQEISSSKNKWEQKCLIASMVWDNGKYKGLLGIVAVDNLYKKEQYFNIEKVPNVTISRIYKSYIGGKTHKASENRFPYSSDINLVYNDLGKGTLSRVQYACSKTQENYYLINCDKDTLKKLILTLDCDENLFIMASSLEKRPVAKRGPSKRLEQVFEVNDSYYKYQSTSIDLSVGGYYLPVHNNNILPDNRVSRNTKIGNVCSNIRNACKELSITGTVFGMRKATVKKITSKNYKGKKWINILDHITETVKNKYTKNDFYNNSDAKYEYENYKEILPFLDKELWFYKYIDKVKQIKDKSDVNRKNLENFGWLNLDILGLSTDDNLEKDIEKISKEYPLLGIIYSRYNYRDFFKQIAEYITLIENKEKK